MFGGFVWIPAVLIRFVTSNIGFVFNADWDIMEIFPVNHQVILSLEDVSTVPTHQGSRLQELVTVATFLSPGTFII